MNIQDKVIAKLCTVLLDEWDSLDEFDKQCCATYLISLGQSINSIPHKMKEYFRDAIERSSEEERTSQ